MGGPQGSPHKAWKKSIKESLKFHQTVRSLPSWMFYNSILRSKLSVYFPKNLRIVPHDKCNRGSKRWLRWMWSQPFLDPDPTPWPVSGFPASARSKQGFVMRNQHSRMRNKRHQVKKLNIEIIYETPPKKERRNNIWVSNSNLRISPKELKRDTRMHTCTFMFTAALFTLTKG